MAESIQSGTILKNTLFLYGRMIITIAVGLYTSRVVLDVFGVSDFGIYNVAGGIVTMMAFLNVGMNQASARFISFAIGKKDQREIKKAFGTSVMTHLTISLLVLLAAEAAGVWFLNTHLNIPGERMAAANWVFQFSIISFVLSINTCPYSSCIISHEHMDVYAYVSIIDVVLKLVVVVALKFVEWDKLILYAAFCMLISVVNTCINVVYARRHFEECGGRILYDRALYKEMFSFAGWGMIGNMGFSTKDQGSNILLNLFFGTAINGARGVAGQVNSIINGFAGNFTTALNPQIIKLYASGNKEESKRLVMSGARLAFYLLSFIAIPFIINVEYVLGLWLVEVPQHTTAFVIIILSATLIYSLSHTLSTAIAATGHFKWFQLFLAMTLLAELPMSYVILESGGAPYQALLPYPFTCLLSLLVRIIIMHHYEPDYGYTEYLAGVVMRCMAVFCVSFAISSYLQRLLPLHGIWLLSVGTVISVIVNTILVFAIGVTRDERLFVLRKVQQFTRKKQ